MIANMPLLRNIARIGGRGPRAGEMHNIEPEVRAGSATSGPGVRTIVQSHLELIAALFSGLMMLIAWLLDTNGYAAAAVAVYVASYAVGGYAKAREGLLETVQDRKLNVELLMILAAVGSAAIGYWAEGAMLIFIFALSGALETYAMNRNRREIAALLALQPETALRVGPDGAEDVVTIERLQVGDVLRVKPGERIPADGVLVQGRTYVDESAITGEAYPVGKAAGDPVFAGTVNLRGSFLMETTKPNSETLFSQIIRLVQSAQREKAPSQQFIERHEGTYVKIVLAAVAATIVLPPFIAGWSWTESVYRAMVLLVVASPCALVASVMPAALAAIAAGARRGILFKGGAHLEQLGRIRAIAFDKTGTLTKGRPEITDIVPRDGLSERELLRYAAGVEQYSDHPLAAAIVRHAAGLGAAPVRPEQTEDIAGHGVSAVIEGERWLAGKAEFVGAAEAAAFRGGIAAELSRQGKTLVFLRDERGIAGLIAFQDVVREEAADAVRALKRLGITPVMLTGDGRATAEAIARESGIEAVVAECLPETKAAEVKRLAARFGPTAMVGDGINDAPALAAADVGIAMGQGTDAALETADVVLMKNDLPRLAEAVRLSRRMNRIVRQNIAFSVAVIALLVASNFTQALDLPLGVIGHEGSTILVILNGLRLLRG